MFTLASRSLACQTSDLLANLMPGKPGVKYSTQAHQMEREDTTVPLNFLKNHANGVISMGCDNK